MSVRAKVVLELGVIAILTTIFLTIFPKRNPLLDVALAGFALLGIALSAPYTKKVIWAASPLPIADHRTKRCWVATLWITVPPVLLFLLYGGSVAYRHGGAPAVCARIFNWRILAAFSGYLPWALMQQTLLEFYLLGRLAALFPKRLRFVAFMITGICFGLVHLPDIWTALVTVATGMVWSFLYFRYRMLLPLAFSHAALGSAFYYGLIGHDLAAEWKAAFP